MTRVEPLLLRIASTAAILYTAVALTIGLADIAFILRHYTTYPFGDHWIWLSLFSSRGLSGALLSQYNEHRLVVPGLLYWIDLRFFGGRNAFLISASVVINAACIVVLALVLIRQVEIPRPVRMVFFGFVTMAMLWYIQGPNFFYAFSLCLALANLGLLSSIYLFTEFYGRESSRQPNGAWLLAGSILCGFVGTFSYGHGILIWPLLVFNAVVLRFRARHLAVIAGAALLALTLYFRHYVTPTAHTSPLQGLHSPLRSAAYLVMMIGLPWLGADNAQIGFRFNIAQYGITIIGLGLALLAIGLFVFRRATTDYAVFYSSLLMLAIGSAIITALGRSSFPISQSLSGRYAPIPLIFWISLLALVIVYLCRIEAAGGAGRFVLCACLAVISMATVPTQFIAGPYLAGREKEQEATVDSIAIGVPDLASLKRDLYPALAVLKNADRGLMRAVHRHSFFVLPQEALLGSPMQPEFRIVGKCESIIDEARLYEAGQNEAGQNEAGQNQGVRLSGWLFDRDRGKAADNILVTTGAGRIIGFGVGQIPRPDVGKAFGNRSMNDSGWIAYSPLPPDGSRNLRVFGEFRGASGVCEVFSPKTSIPQ